MLCRGKICFKRWLEEEISDITIERSPQCVIHCPLILGCLRPNRVRKYISRVSYSMSLAALNNNRCTGAVMVR